MKLGIATKAMTRAKKTAVAKLKAVGGSPISASSRSPVCDYKGTGPSGELRDAGLTNPFKNASYALEAITILANAD